MKGVEDDTSREHRYDQRMLQLGHYRLVDFGQGRKLEDFGGVLVDRPCPAATGRKAQPEWTGDAKYTRQSEQHGTWLSRAVPNRWEVEFESQTFELRLTESGQVGIFPEQVPNWKWIHNTLSARPRARILNLFGYTGGSTLAAAAAGAEVVHVDSARSVVTWARRNAQLSGLSGAPIRWIVEDAPKFVAREIKRGNQYDGIILDPPSFGRGPKREEWKLTRDLFGLLAACKQLLSPASCLFLLSCHTPGFGPPELSAALSSCLFGSCGAGVRTRDLSLRSGDGRRLAAGHAAFWAA